ncbi:MAG TPA: NYN domain-containing protein [Pirellulaceae bacterium]|nr:NYN domain-containing protein [Planctomycetales bacterium]MCB9940473.1 NYN domain-containing protein [Planctomycetaceae bacterium]HRX79146.1 NYN domain-containing protein [Pirellulaceae bacterium]
MLTLIDGYNLLHVTGLAGPEISRSEIGRGALERARNALLNFLASSLDAEERQLTVVAFDSNDAPPGLPRELQHQGITVKFATAYESADELLEELIRESSAPRRMTVVSSDHRVQKAARRRRARAVDSDIWYAEIRESRRRTDTPPATRSVKPTSPLSEDEVAAWLLEFGDVSYEQLSPSSTNANGEATGSEPPVPTPIENPFPPGYGEDLLDQDEM